MRQVFYGSQESRAQDERLREQLALAEREAAEVISTPLESVPESDVERRLEVVLTTALEAASVAQVVCNL